MLKKVELVVLVALIVIRGVAAIGGVGIGGGSCCGGVGEASSQLRAYLATICMVDQMTLSLPVSMYLSIGMWAVNTLRPCLVPKSTNPKTKITTPTASPVVAVFSHGTHSPLDDE